MEMKTVKNNKRQIVKAVILASAVAFANTAMAYEDHDDDYHRDTVGQYTDTCDTLFLIDTALSGKPNTDVCVDAPVALTKVKTVFDINTKEAPNGVTGLKHLMMLGTALKLRIKAGLVDPKDVRVIGVLHGSGIFLAMKDSPNTQATKFIEDIFALERAGVNITLEVCGVTMHSNGKTNADLYTGVDGGVIHVNQGAIGRIIDLEQHGYALIKE